MKAVHYFLIYEVLPVENYISFFPCSLLSS